MNKCVLLLFGDKNNKNRDAFIKLDFQFAVLNTSSGLFQVQQGGVCVCF